MVYFDSLHKLPRMYNSRHLLLHSLMLSICEESGQEGWLLEALDKLEQELSIVYEIDASELESACRG